MNKEQRKTEILSKITAFGKDTYTKAEFLPELLKLQEELINVTYNCEHAENANLRLWDVEKHLQDMNAERGHIADASLNSFINGSKVVCNTIKAEFSGNAGEQRVFQALETIGCQNGVLHNVELEFDGKRTELDAIVFTKQAVFIIEVKNSKKNIYIDENGDFYRIGSSMHYDCNIAEKMDEREELLRRALERAGMEHMKIFKIITFTNKYIDVECKYRYIKVLPVSYLAHFIENFKTSTWCSFEDICTMMAAVEEIKCKEAYQMSIDMNEYKECFADLVATLEAADENQEELIEEQNNNDVAKTDSIKENKREDKTAYSFGMGAVAATIGIVLVNAAVFTCRKLFK